MVTMQRVVPVSPESYERVALNDPDGQWELFDGVLQEKPGMSVTHNRVGFLLGVHLHNALDPNVFEVRSNAGRLRVSAERYYIPDVIVIPRSLTVDLARRPEALDLYTEPLPFVAEIWYVHPYDRTITVWRRRPDGTYAETSPAFGPVEIASLPGVTIDLAALLGRA